MSTAKWHKKVLIPFWVMEMVLLTIVLIVVIASIIIYKKIAEYPDLPLEYYTTRSMANIFLILGAAVTLAMCVVSLILDTTIIILYKFRNLGPVAYLVLSILKLLMWGYALASNILAVLSSKHTALGVFFAALIFSTCLGQLIYGSVVLHRYRKDSSDRGMYASAAKTTASKPSMMQSTSYGPYDPQAGRTTGNTAAPAPTRQSHQSRIERHADERYYSA